MSGYMNLARSNNMIGVATTNFYPIVSVSGSTATAPVTNTAKPVTTTLAPVITTTSAKPVTTTCANGSGYYLVPNSGCQKCYYCDDFYLYSFYLLIRIYSKSNYSILCIKYINMRYIIRNLYEWQWILKLSWMWKRLLLF